MNETFNDIESKLYSWARRGSKELAYNLSSNESSSSILVLPHRGYFGMKVCKETINSNFFENI